MSNTGDTRNRMMDLQQQQAAAPPSTFMNPSMPVQPPKVNPNRTAVAPMNFATPGGVMTPGISGPISGLFGATSPSADIYPGGGGGGTGGTGAWNNKAPGKWAVTRPRKIRREKASQSDYNPGSIVGYV